MSQYKDIRDFHKKFKFKQGKGIDSMDYNFSNWRVDFLMEEIAELTDALDNKDDVEILDALVDICYVAMGTAWLMGLPFEEAWKEVQRSNMEKVREPSERSENDVIKPEGWKKPDIKGIVKRWQKS
jgi:predicted HAD superfamily Cof-like phosphohydrolase